MTHVLDTSIHLYRNEHFEA